MSVHKTNVPMAHQKNAELLTVEDTAKKFILNLNTDSAKNFILNGESTGNEEVDALLQDSSHQVYYLIEEKIERLRKDKDFNKFYEKHYDEEIESAKQDIIEMLGKNE